MKWKPRKMVSKVYELNNWNLGAPMDTIIWTMNNEKWWKRFAFAQSTNRFSYKLFQKIECLPVSSQEKGNRSRFLHLVMPLIVGCTQMPGAYAKSFPIYQGKIGDGNQLQLVAVGRPQPHCWLLNCSLCFLIRKWAFMYGGVSCMKHVSMTCAQIVGGKEIVQM
jgi:hypothetical protein